MSGGCERRPAQAAGHATSAAATTACLLQMPLGALLQPAPERCAPTSWRAADKNMGARVAKVGTGRRRAATVPGSRWLQRGVLGAERYHPSELVPMSRLQEGQQGGRGGRLTEGPRGLGCEGWLLARGWAPAVRCLRQSEKRNWGSGSTKAAAPARGSADTPRRAAAGPRTWLISR